MAQTFLGRFGFHNVSDPILAALLLALRPDDNPRTGTATLNAALRLSVGSASAPEAPDSDITDVYLHETAPDMPVTFIGGGTFTRTDISPHQRKFPVASVSGAGTTGNLNDGTEAVDWRVGFVTDADRVAFRVDGGGTVMDAYRFIVNGDYVSEAEPATVGGGRRWLVLDLGPGTHTVMMESYLDKPFIGFGLPAGASLAPLPDAPRAIILGDSFTAASGATNAADGFGRVFADVLGLGDLWASGLGETGYLGTAADGTTGFDRYTLAERYSVDITRALDDGDLDIVVIAAGLNDQGQGDVTANAQAVFDGVRTLCPTAQVIVLGPWLPEAPGTAPAAWLAVRDQIKTEAVGRSGFFYIETEAQGYTKADATHPDDAGHLALGTWLAGEVLTALSA